MCLVHFLGACISYSFSGRAPRPKVRFDPAFEAAKPQLGRPEHRRALADLVDFDKSTSPREALQRGAIDEDAANG